MAPSLSPNSLYIILHLISLLFLLSIILHPPLEVIRRGRFMEMLPTPTLHPSPKLDMSFLGQHFF
jgi:hypothetical protein